MDNQQIAIVLKAAKEKIVKPENWTRGAFARNVEGMAISPINKSAICFCAKGAIGATASRLQYTPVAQYLDLIAHHCDSTTWMSAINYNDSHTHSEVLALFDKAILAAQQGETK